MYTYQNLDRGLFELIGPTGIYKSIANISAIFVEFYNSKILAGERIRALNVIFHSMLLGILGLSFFFCYTNLTLDIDF